MDRFFSDQIGPLPALTLIVLSVVCTITDLWKGKIFNAVTYSAMILGLGVQLAQHGWSGLALGAGGFAVGFFPAFLLFALGGLGGGDVKLLGAVGILAGPVPTTEVMIVAFLFGGLFALVKLAWQGVLFATLWRTLRWLFGMAVPGVTRPSLEAEKRVEIRFGLAICLAVLAVLWGLKSGGVASLMTG